MRVIVKEWERVVLLRDGWVDRVLEPGQHRVRARGIELQRMDIRERQYVVPGQEILTADAIVVKVSAIVVWRVEQPAAFLTVAEAPVGRMHTAVQQVLRERVASRSLDELLADRDSLVADVAPLIGDLMAPLGLGIVSIALRDLMLPADVRRAVNEVLLARERGRADLERARSEVAALRSLANTARLLEEHPGLLHLRTLQAVGQGATLVVTPPQPNAG